jgi:signal transduction histidine kinase
MGLPQVPGPSRRLANAIIILTGCAAAATAFAFASIGSAGRLLQQVNNFYSPALRYLSSASGKLDSYRKGLDRDVLFTRWGEKGLELPHPRLNLKRMLDSDLEALNRLLTQQNQTLNPSVVSETRVTSLRFNEVLALESARLAELAVFVKNRRYQDAAALYMALKSDHRDIAHRVQSAVLTLEDNIRTAQYQAEQKVNMATIILVAVVMASLIVAFIAGWHLRRVIEPVHAWREAISRLVTHIRSNGFAEIKVAVPMPEVQQGLPPEIVMLAQDLSNMATTAMEHERTIRENKNKLQHMNEHLKEQNNELRRLGSLNERILNVMTSALVVVDKNNRIEQFNDAFAQMFLLSRSDILSNDLGILNHVFSDASINSWLMTFESVTHRGVLANNNKYYDIHVQPILAQVEQNVRSGLVISFDDVTEQVVAQEQLAHKNKITLVSHMSAQVAHEVRNPLNAMVLQLELLDDDCSELGPSVRNRIANVLEQVSRLERITEKYLDVSVEHASVPIKKDSGSFLLHDLIESVVDFYSPNIQAIQARIHLDLKAKNTLIQGDKDRISQVLVNLVANAIDAVKEQTQGDRRIEIKTESINNYLHIHIQDSGPGVEQKMQDKLFEPFVTSKARGHGLGLSIARQICADHRGSLKYNGRSHFEVSLPC